jgi:pimeloyl-ACP methyl ester carboxylesterase
MSGSWFRRNITVAAVAALGVTAPPAAATTGLEWSPCADGFECASFTVPLDYDRPSRGSLSLPVTRKRATEPARRIGSLFVNFGGPGGSTVETLHGGGIGAFADLNDRYDIVGWDPRGTGGTGAIDCHANLEQIGPIVQPFARPDDLDVGRLLRNITAYNARCVALNARILPHISTADVARDMDRLRGLLREDRAHYFGYSYGTFLGATYEALFPHRVGRFVLDGALNPDQYINDPVQSIRLQTRGFEVELGRFLQACARDQSACAGFGGDDPWVAYDALLERMDATALPAGGDDPRPVDGDDLRAGTMVAFYTKQNWPLLAQALRMAANGDGTLVRVLADAYYGWVAPGDYTPGWDRYYAITATEARWPRLSVGDWLKIGADDFELFEHFWFNSGYFDFGQGLWPVKASDAYFGPFGAPRSALPTLVIGTTYDPATPFRGAQRLTARLGNARLLTMVGDGHTAYPGNTACIDDAVEAYLEQGRVPPAGTRCVQEVPFSQAAARGGPQLVRPWVWPLR